MSIFKDSFDVIVEPKNLYLNDIPNSVQLTIKNQSEIDYRGGYGYAIDFYDGENWIPIVIPEVIAEELVIGSGETFYIRINLMPGSHNYVAGRYRIRFSSWYAEFKIYE